MFSDQVQYNLTFMCLPQKDCKQKSNFRNKPWITLGLQKSTYINNHLLTKYIKLKDVTLKNEARIKYKQYKKVIPVYKKDSKLKCSSFRPSSLLSNI